MRKKAKNFSQSVKREVLIKRKKLPTLFPADDATEYYEMRDKSIKCIQLSSEV